MSRVRQPRMLRFAGHDEMGAIMSFCAERTSNPLVSFEHSAETSTHVLKVRGELDIYTAPLFTAALKETSNAARVIIDLRECVYLDASAITALVKARKDSPIPIRLVLRDGSMVQRVFGITNVDRLFWIFSTVEAASAWEPIRQSRRKHAGDISRSTPARGRSDRADRRLR